jgi:hypothetical protein
MTTDQVDVREEAPVADPPTMKQTGLAKIAAISKLVATHLVDVEAASTENALMKQLQQLFGDHRASLAVHHRHC